MRFLDRASIMRISKWLCHAVASSAFVVLAVGLAACGTSRVPESSPELVRVHYEAGFADGRDGPASVTYLRADGTTAREEVQLPWKSREFSFREGSQAMLLVDLRTGPAEFAALNCHILTDQGFYGKETGRATGGTDA
jgi:hypothetical protein